MHCLSRRSVGLLSVVAAVIAFQSSPSANHSWGGYHWARTGNPFTVALGDNVSSTWDGHLTIASQDWSASGVLDTVVAPGGAKPRNCRPTAGRVEVCNATYGNTGWLGVAQIWITDGTHITQGTVKLNDTYFNTPSYNSSAWRQFVACQEIGHTFGLDHQDENFSNTNLGTCMDYTNDPDGSRFGQLSNEHPNKHDYDELVTIYNHLDSFSTVGAATSSAAPAVLDNPSEWGQLMKVSRGGKVQVFERDFGNGQRVVTFVIWA
jgi:hypothetical protein